MDYNKVLGVIYSIKYKIQTDISTAFIGIVAVYLAFASIAQPLYVAIIFGISLIMEGVLFLTTSIDETN